MRSCIDSVRIALVTSVATLSVAGFSPALAQSADCDVGQIISERPERNAKLVVCTAAARRVPALEAEVRRLAALVEKGGQPAADVERFIRQLNATAARIEGKSDQLARSVADLLSKERAQSDAAVSRQLAQLALQFEMLQEKIDTRNSDAATAGKTRVALAGNVGDAIARLDLATANRMLDELAAIRRDIGGVSAKVDEANKGIARIERATECVQATPANMALAVRGKSADTVLEMLKCRRELLVDRAVRAEVAELFKPVAFPASRGFLEQVRAGGVSFLRDLGPTTAGDFVRGLYMTTPLATALNLTSVDALDWLLAGTRQDDLAGYPDLLPYMLGALRAIPASGPPSTEAVSRLLKAGLPTSGDGHRAYRIAHERWLATQDVPSAGLMQIGFARHSGGSPPPSDVVAQSARYWRAMADLLAPRAAGEKAAIDAELASQFVRPRLEAISSEIERLRRMLSQPGLRTDARGRNFEVPASAVRDGDLVLDLDRDLSADGWAAVTTIKEQIALREQRRQKLMSMSRGA